MFCVGLRLIDHPGDANGLGFPNYAAQPFQFFHGQETLSAALFELFNPPRRVRSFWNDVGAFSKSVHAAKYREHPIGLIRRVGKGRMKLADLLSGKFVRLCGAQRWLHNTVENVAVELRRSALALRFDVFSHEPVCQFGNSRHRALGGFLSRWIAAVRHRPQNDSGTCSGVLWSDLANRCDCVTAHWSAAAG